MLHMNFIMTLFLVQSDLIYNLVRIYCFNIETADFYKLAVSFLWFFIYFQFPQEGILFMHG